MKMKARYYKCIKGNHYYQRAVPVDLTQHYQRKVIQVPLKGSFEDIERQLNELGQKHSAEFAALRGGARATPKASMSVLAREMLRTDAWNIEIDEQGEFTKEDLIDQAIHAMAAEGNLVAQKAIELKSEPGACTITEAIEIWLEWKADQRNDDNEKHARLSVRYLTEAVGDKPLTLFTRADAKAYVDFLFERDVASSTVRRNLNNVVSVINRARSQLGLDMVNPFERYELPRRKDTTTRQPYTPDEMQKIIEAGMESQSHTWLLALMGINVGARIGELVGLARNDVKLQANIPHIVIEERPWRSLKTASSNRAVPLTGVSLQAAQIAMQKFEGAENEPLFQMYWSKREKINTRSASAGVNKVLKKKTDKKTSHSARHRVISDLTAVGCPLEIIESISGHSTQSIANRVYNKADIPLDVKLKWLEEIAV